MEITYNNIDNKTYVNIYIKKDDVMPIDKVKELKEKYKHVAVFRSGDKPVLPTLLNILKDY